MELIKVDRRKCKKDGACVEVCPACILELDPDEGPRMKPNQSQYCLGCGHCVAVCPHGAIDNAKNPLAKQVPLTGYTIPDQQTAFTFLRSRRSIRKFKDEPVPKEVLLKVLEIARYAPSEHNDQGISYIVVSGREILSRMSEIVVDWLSEMVRSQPKLARAFGASAIIQTYKDGEDIILRRAPQVIVAVGSKKRSTVPIATYLALEYVEIYAPVFGLGTCWAGYAQICARQTSAMSEFLEIPEDQVISGMMMVGYPKHAYHRLPERNPLQVQWISD
ncbi:MAG: nitroreductase family protein [Syntrophobacteraceae bacterium]